MAREELKWQNIDADDLPAAVKKSFDAMLEAEDKDDLEKLAAAEPKMLLPVVVLPQPLLGRTPWPRSTSCCC